MSMNVFLAIVMAAGSALAQPAAQSKPDPASISGLIRDAKTGMPLTDATIEIDDLGDSSSAPIVSVSTNSLGRYEAKGLEGGQFRIRARGPRRPGGRLYKPATRSVTVRPGQDLTSADLVLYFLPAISGTVTDENDEPVPNTRVHLIEREYVFGVLRYRFRDTFTTDESGHYEVGGNTTPGRAYLLMVRARFGSIEDKLAALSQAPADPKLRKKTFAPTYYPGTDLIQSAQPIVLGPGELREGVDIRIRRSRSFCISGTLKSGGGSQGMDFSIAEQEPAYMAGGVLMRPVTGTTGADGRFRICDLHPGDYVLTAYSSTAVSPTPEFLVRTPITVADKDVEIAVQALPQVTVRGEIAWDGDAPPDPLRLTVAVSNVTRGISFVGEAAPDNPSYANSPAPWRYRMTAPGQFSFNHVYEDEYAVKVSDLPTGAYVKDITYNGRSILYDAFRAGRESGQSSLRIVLARNGGSVTVRMADKDDNPLPDVTVVLLPEISRSDGVLASTMVVGQTDQNGEWSSAILAPGKYFVIGTKALVDKSPEGISRLTGMRTKAYELQINSGVPARLVLKPIEE